MKSSPNCKINLGLRVVRKRPDGYHDLETLFYPCTELRDTLAIKEDTQFGIDITRDAGKVDWDPMQDLTARAYRLLREDFDLPPVHIYLRKSIPVGAGLGGGSADGAFALKMLNGMFGLHLDEAQLAAYAARLGSDCPFFIYNRPMLGTGRGEVLTEAPSPFDTDRYQLRLHIPEGISVSTREAYSGIIPSGEGQEPLLELLSRPLEEWNGRVVNDFEKTVFAVHPQLGLIKQMLYDQGAVYASMSGSGSALFGIFPKNQ